MDVESKDASNLEFLPSRISKAKKKQLKAESNQNAASEPKISKKRKRKLDKYIQSKLKKESRKELLDRLAKTSIDPSTQLGKSLKSSSTLGSGKLKTNEDKLKEFDKKISAEAAAPPPRKKRKVVHEDEDEETDEELKDVKPTPSLSVNPAPAHQNSTSASKSDPEPVSFGGALKAGVKPVVVTRKRKSRGRIPVKQTTPSKDSDSSFDSSVSGSDESQDDQEESDNENPSKLLSSTNKIKKGTFLAWAESEQRRIENSSTIPPIPESSKAPHNAPSSHPTSSSLPKSVIPSLPEGISGPLGTVLPSLTPSSLILISSAPSKPPSLSPPPSFVTLPIDAHESEIMETVLGSTVVVLVGETGCGKTTRVPRMLYAWGFGSEKTRGMIGITQPRRISAVSLASRVSEELGLPKDDHLVSYAVRFSTTTREETRIKFMTDGVLLRELGEDFLLRKYEVLVIDEAHERSVGTDVLIGCLSRVVRVREKRWREWKEKKEKGEDSGKEVEPVS